ncbi:MAG: glycogen synthase, partial [Firmicutes bacterium]|nr:glycogen synthase [Bacillota bacterium]
MKNVLIISSEGVPFAKSGGLGDVIGALPKELKAQGVNVRVILPLYKTVKDTYGDQLKFIDSYGVGLSWRMEHCGLFETEYEGVTFYFIDNEKYFRRDSFYGYGDDAERFAFFSKAVLESIPKMEGFEPEILHCNDWQTAMIPVFLKTVFMGSEYYSKFRTVFTIHNIEYQGRYGMELLGDLLGIDQAYAGLVRLDGDLNMMKGAVVACDKLTTVSPTYAQEILYPFYGKGMQDIIRENEYKLVGILNGIDVGLFNPETDKNLSARYTAETVERKVQNKMALQEALGLEVNADIPMIGMVGRLVEHKGIGMVREAYDAIIAAGAQIVLLGTGSKSYEDFFKSKAWAYQGKAATVTAFSGPLANKIYAGSDLFLMPSVSEPCGLAQMISLRYGTSPIVRETGGLADSVA